MRPECFLKEAKQEAGREFLISDFRNVPSTIKSVKIDLKLINSISLFFLSLIKSNQLTVYKIPFPHSMFQIK